MRRKERDWKKNEKKMEAAEIERLRKRTKEQIEEFRAEYTRKEK
jgi:hypothetical protein